MISRVIVSPDTLYTCLSHALSTEHQEIMGLLLGSLVNDKKEVYIERSMVLRRKDKKKDRVEVSYADLGLASTVADDLKLRVVGWYHSHPHITVLPSHVDVKTQGQYQVLGEFLGLIFSVFDKGRLEMCAFQSRQKNSGEWERVEIPIIVSNKVSFFLSHILQSERRLFESLIAMQLVLMNEDKETFEKRLSSTNQSGSYLDVSKSLTVYQNGLLRLVDLQICPLLMAMKSKIDSLKFERDTILRQLQQYSTIEEKKVDEKQPNASSEEYGWLANSPSSKAPSVINSDKGGMTEESIKALKALETTMPKWNLSVRALKIAFAGMPAEIISLKKSFETSTSCITGLKKGDRYTIRVNRVDIQTTVKSPWDVIFESNETELEGDFSIGPAKMSLVGVCLSKIEGCIDFTVLLPDEKLPHIERKEVEIQQTNDCWLIVTAKMLYSQEYRGIDCVAIVGEHLQNALRLLLWPK